MIRDFLKSAFRFFSKNKLTAFVSVLGLSVALTLTIHLTLFVKNELSYDKFHQKHDRIYRLLGKVTSPGEEPEYLAICQGQFPMYAEKVPEVESVLRIYSETSVNLEFDNTRITDNRLIYADSTFFNLFSFKVISGNAAEVLSNPDGLLICRSLALKAFGSLDVIGRQVSAQERMFTIGAVLEDVPANSHLQFDMLASFEKSYLEMLVNQSGSEFYTYVLLKENIDKTSALDKVCKAYASNMSDFWNNSDSKYEGMVQPITDIELHSDNYSWDVPHGNIHNIYIAVALILFILIIAIFNVVNLFTVNAEAHVKEVGMRKASGASRFDLIKKYLGEAEIITMVSLLLAMFLVKGSWSFFNSFIGKNISFSELFDLKLIAGLFLLSVTIGAVSGIYPAVYLSRFSISRIFRGSSSKGGKISPLIKGIVLSQFFIVIFLVSCLFVFYRQMNYIKNKDLGFNKECVVAIKGLDVKVFDSYRVIKEKLLQNDGIVNVCLAQAIADDRMSGQYVDRVGGKKDEQIISKHTRTTEGFIKMFNIEIVEGRDFNELYSTDKSNFIINEAECKALGFNGSAVGQQIVMQDTGIVIGVVKDFNFSSLHNAVAPLIITFHDKLYGNLYVKLKPSYIHEGLSVIGNTVKEIDPLYALDYEFVDDTFNKMYMQESKISKMLLSSATISIVLALMGLIALTSFVIIRRVKEIGIRKVNGATVSDMLILLNIDFAKWVLASFFFAIPVSYLIMHKWLEGFAFNAGISWWIFVLSGLSMLLATIIAVSSICWNAAGKNPAEALKYE